MMFNEDYLDNNNINERYDEKSITIFSVVNGYIECMVDDYYNG